MRNFAPQCGHFPACPCMRRGALSLCPLGQRKTIESSADAASVSDASLAPLAAAAGPMDPMAANPRPLGEAFTPLLEVADLLNPDSAAVALSAIPLPLPDTTAAATPESLLAAPLSPGTLVIAPHLGHLAILPASSSFVLSR